ncbi:MAG TPA: hypothetical protein VFK00_06620 [Rhodanobacteraceae bacterium]|nr:hypothetical protein [Rhodanobacteraceae bacterium]
MAARDVVVFLVACGLDFFAAAVLDVFLTGDDLNDFFTMDDLVDFFAAGDLADFFTAGDFVTFFAATDLRLAGAGRAFLAAGLDAVLRIGFAAAFAACILLAGLAVWPAFLSLRLAAPCLDLAMSLHSRVVEMRPRVIA